MDEVEKYKSCKYVRSIGQVVVNVQPNCPYGRVIAGELMVLKRDCDKCRFCKEKGDRNEISGRDVY